MLARAELPNLAKIRAGGNYTRLKTTYPAQTPVAWSSFATGTNPGGHGIFDSGIERTTRVIGPRNTRQSPPADSSCEIRLRVDKGARKLVIRTGGAPTLLEIPARGWSEWVRLKFKVSMLQSVSGIVRFYVRQLEPHLAFYAAAVNFDPAAPLFPLSSPANYAKELSEQIGLFSTLGRAEDHNGLKHC